MLTDPVLHIRSFLQNQPLDYTEVWHAMKTFNEKRSEMTQDEIWLLEHAPVFTQGQNSAPSDILNLGEIPLIKTDRGGQITYHGPGQLIVYFMLDLKRFDLNIRPFVTLIENSVIQFLSSYDISGYSRSDAPGIYINHQKIASLGLRIRKFCSYHGLSLNVKMDLEPFSRIHPCGQNNLSMTQFCFLHSSDFISLETIGRNLIKFFVGLLELHSNKTISCSFHNEDFHSLCI